MYQLPEGDVDDEETRLHHSMKSQQDWLAGYGVEMEEASIQKHDEHFVLQYEFTETCVDSGSLRLNCWATRQQDGLICDLQLEVMDPEGQDVTRVRSLMKEIAGRGFVFVLEKQKGGMKP